MASKDNLDDLIECWARAMRGEFSPYKNSIEGLMLTGIVIQSEFGCRVLDYDEVAERVQFIVRNLKITDIIAANVLSVHYGAVKGFEPHICVELKARVLKVSRSRYFEKLNLAREVVRSGLMVFYRDLQKPIDAVQT